MQETLPLQWSSFCRELQPWLVFSWRVSKVCRVQDNPERVDGDLETVGFDALRLRNCAMVFVFHNVRTWEILVVRVQISVYYPAVCFLLSLLWIGPWLASIRLRYVFLLRSGRSKFFYFYFIFYILFVLLNEWVMKRKMMESQSVDYRYITISV